MECLSPEAGGKGTTLRAHGALVSDGVNALTGDRNASLGVAKRHYFTLHRSICHLCLTQGRKEAAEQHPIPHTGGVSTMETLQSSHRAGVHDEATNTTFR